MAITMNENPPENAVPAPTMARLVEGCRELHIPLTAQQIDQFEHYFQLLVQWNERLNLTAITGYEDVQIKHYLDSLVSLPLLAEELGAPLPWTRPLRAVDVGSGAGFPGLPLKIAAPALEMMLMDGTQKKVNFLQEVTTALGLTGVRFVTGRAEELGRQEMYREQFELVTARAVAPLNTLVEYLLPLVAVNGLAVIYKGPGAPEEFVAARQAIRVLGGETVRFAPAAVPFLAEGRFILLLKKVRATPRQFPRGQGLARKRPLT